MQTQEFIDLLSQIQFSQTLSWQAYILIAFVSGGAVVLSSYLKEKGKNYASKEDFEELKGQLAQSTKLVEDIKAKVSEKTWINQQKWVKKQEAYEAIFDLLIHVNKYVVRQVDDFEEWEYIDKYHPYFQYLQYNEDNESLRKQLEKDKAEYNERVNSPEHKDEAEKLKQKYEVAIDNLLDLVDVKAIYLNSEVGAVVAKLKIELARTYDEEDWDSHFQRLSTETKNAINKIKEISKVELKIEI
ncbi:MULTISPECIES: hypothetical protein [Pseudoalteromonas]|uniref:hypothetical protein n=1 Tax=Pseudoalteromonas TaxID=53246 RepID=UPI0002C939E2|nr:MULTISPECIES: hypothetical protein [Pseudoalteromonas]ENN97384.1 hypothetical protein J139_17892 [Pseudoalteromonas agarivorans S816]TMS65403.1 hypothetical protein CWB83_13500 [Pseudoalteromonas sp. S1691]TMS71457.1 hypothetical protein CWB86_05380 [Pseudoalteromonas sp. S1731]TMS73179.1 hypothetical protein CWB88_13020 [Pseudoalteromonas sp. S1941]TMS76047.1 hypothetical protein CWB82_18075 [Pseudoalteromonas sp. S1690]